MAQITTKVAELLTKGAIVETQVTLESFASQLFLVKKNSGGSNKLNQYVKTKHFIVLLPSCSL